MSVVYETEYARVLDSGVYWVVEDKVLSQLPVVERASTKTFYRIEAEYVDLGDGTLAIARWYLPKSVPKQIVMNMAERINAMWLERVEEAERTMRLMQGQQPAAQPQEEIQLEVERAPTSELAEALERIRRVLRELGVE
jgi:PP-loop superfamily ATP-utilizing enzyme